MSAQKMDAEEFAESLTGFEEIAIAKHFGKDDFSELPGSMGLRAMAFVALKRDGQSDKDAYDAVMGMSLKACSDMFSTPEPEVDDNDPITESGKGVLLGG